MTVYDTQSEPMDGLSTPPGWVRIVLGLVLILAGLLVIADLTLATIVSAFVLGIIAIACGAFEIIHAWWTKGWGGFVWQVLLGVLYIAFGLALVSEPVAGALILTYVLGLLLFASGFVRILLGVSHWKEVGWVMLLSGLFGILAGLIILTGFPMTGLWVLGLLLGIDLISHGIAWTTYAWFPGARTV